MALYLALQTVLLIAFVESRVDWSTREQAQKWFDEFAERFDGLVESGDSFSTLMVDYTENVIDCNPTRCYDNKQELIVDLDAAFKLISSFEAYFDIVVWSKHQVLTNIIYIHQGINGKRLVFRALLLSKMNEDGMITHWIYTAEESMLAEVNAFWSELSSFKAGL